MDIGKSVKAPCQNCTDRKLNCHSNCTKYKMYKDKLEENRKKYLAEKEAENAYFRSKEGISGRAKGIKNQNKMKGQYRTS